MSDLNILKNNIKQSVDEISDQEILENIIQYINDIRESMEDENLTLTEKEKERLKTARTNYKQGNVRRL